MQEELQEIMDGTVAPLAGSVDRNVVTTIVSEVTYGRSPRGERG